MTALRYGVPWGVAARMRLQELLMAVRARNELSAPAEDGAPGVRDATQADIRKFLG